MPGGLQTRSSSLGVLTTFVIPEGLPIKPLMTLILTRGTDLPVPIASEAIVKAGLSSGPYEPRTNRHCANADVLAGLLNEVLSKRKTGCRIYLRPRTQCGCGKT